VDPYIPQGKTGEQKETKMGKTGGGRGTNQHQVKGRSQAQARAGSRKPAIPAGPPAGQTELSAEQLRELRAKPLDDATEQDVQAVCAASDNEIVRRLCVESGDIGLREPHATGYSIRYTTWDDAWDDAEDYADIQAESWEEKEEDPWTLGNYVDELRNFFYKTDVLTGDDDGDLIELAARKMEYPHARLLTPEQVERLQDALLGPATYDRYGMTEETRTRAALWKHYGFEGDFWELTGTDTSTWR
jgi:hypothetical protein